MARMKIYTDRTSPAAARVTLSRMKNTVGTVPALAGVLAGAPMVLDAGTGYVQAFMQTSLAPPERIFVLLIASREFGSEYCHELMAQMAGKNKLPDSVVRAVRERREIRKKPFNVLGPFVETVASRIGGVEDQDLEKMHKAGYGEKQILEIIMGVSVAWLWSSMSAVADLTSVDQGS